MSNEDFIYIVLENIALIFICLICSFVIYYFIFKKIICSFFDPLALQLIASSFAFAVMLFMYIGKLVEPIYYYQYVITQIVYWLGFFSFKHTDLFHTDIPVVKVKNNLLWTKSVFWVTSISYLMIQLFVYCLLGIPLFASERLNLFADSNGLGIFQRFLDSLAIAACFSSFCLLANSRKNKIFICLFLVLYFVSLLLSGAKSSMLSIFSCFFFFSIITHKTYLSRKKELLIFLLIALLGVLMLLVNNENFNIALANYMTRLLGFGDVFWLGYNSDIINSIDEPSAFTVLFRDFLGVFRLKDWESLPIPIGRQIFSMIYWNANMGPNMRHNILGYILFGFTGSILFSYLLGWLVGFVRCRLYCKLKNPGLLGIIYFALYSLVVVVETDVPLAIGKMLDFLLTVIFFAPIIFLFYYYYIKNGR